MGAGAQHCLGDGGTLVDPVVATVEGGKIKPVSLSELMK